MYNIVPIILCGGSGKRLWPLSTIDFPKQFVSINNKLSFYQQTLHRAAYFSKYKPIVVTNEEYRFMAAHQATLAGVELETIILEPSAKNTAASVALAAGYIKACADNNYHNCKVLLLPSDHFIQPDRIFAKIINTAVNVSTDDQWVLFGVKPDCANTEYGYYLSEIEESPSQHPIQAVTSFVEKPERQVAERLFLNDNSWWNSGISLTHIDYLQACFRRYQFDLFGKCENAIKDAELDNVFFRIQGDQFNAVTPISLDVAILQQVNNLVHMPLSVEWSDIGSLDALATISNSGCTKESTVKSVSINSGLSKDLYVCGLTEPVVLYSDNAMFVTEKSALSKTPLNSTFEKAGNSQSQSTDGTVYRPWGLFEVLAKSQTYMCKKLTLMPDHAISLQKHQYRSEHWIIVDGIASIVKGVKEFTLQKDESIFIPVGTVHRLANKTNQILIVIEVQTGSKFDEEDIVRIDDRYGRKPSGSE